MNAQGGCDISTSIETPDPLGCFEASAPVQSRLTKAKEFEL
jgi:hypothetical protein